MVYIRTPSGKIGLARPILRRIQASAFLPIRGLGIYQTRLMNNHARLS